MVVEPRTSVAGGWYGSTLSGKAAVVWLHEVGSNALVSFRMGYLVSSSNWDLEITLSQYSDPKDNGTITIRCLCKPHTISLGISENDNNDKMIIICKMRPKSNIRLFLISYSTTSPPWLLPPLQEDFSNSPLPLREPFSCSKKISVNLYLRLLAPSARVFY